MTMMCEQGIKTLMSTPQTRDTPHYHGHRDRLRARFQDSGANSLQDYELLELILFSAIPRRDVKPLAKKLLSTCGTLRDVMNAPIEDLCRVKGISKNTALLLKGINALHTRSMKQNLMNRPIFTNWTALMEYCHTTMGHETKELFRILFLNKKNHLIADEIQQTGTVDHTPVYPREVVKRALDLGATALILVHNHPSNDLRASDDDIRMTHAIMNAAQPLGIIIHDHIIVGRTGYMSFKSEGLL
jgi:DNA repair protein RadC